MENNVIVRKWKNTGFVKVDDLSGLAFTGESGAHSFRIQGFDADDNKQSITGTISGKFWNKDTDITTPLTGSLDDGDALVTFDPACYANDGLFVLTLFSTNGSTVTCIYCGVGSVKTSQSSTIAYPTAAIPDVAALINQIQAILNSWPSDYTQLQNDVGNLKSAVQPNINIGYSITFASKWGANGSGYNIVVPVKSGDAMHIKANASKKCLYSVLKSLDGMETSSTPDFATGYSGLSEVAVGHEVFVTIPSDGLYVYVFTNDAAYIPIELSVNQYNALDDVRGNISALYYEAQYLDNNAIFNAYIQSELTAGYVLNDSNGAAITNQYTSSYAITDYIAVNYGDIVHLAYIAGNTLCGACLYDSGKNFIEPIWGTANNVKPGANINTDFAFIIDDRKVAYLRYNVQPNNVFARDKQYIWITPSKVYQSLNRRFVVGTGEKYTTLKGVLDYINDNKILNAYIHVKPGTYNLVTEFTQTYLDNYEESSNVYLGLIIGNGTHIVFDEGAYITFNYTGANTDVAEHFSAFNVTGSCTIENANIYVSNARYCVHEDLPAGSIAPTPYTVKYVNCTMQHAGNTIGDYTGTVCIGAGTMPNSLSIVEGGKYICGTQFPWAISYHNFYKSTYGNKPSRVILKNVWMNNGFRMGTHGDSVVNVVVTNCKMPSGWYAYDSQYFNLTEWNNVIS